MPSIPRSIPAACTVACLAAVLVTASSASAQETRPRTRPATQPATQPGSEGTARSDLFAQRIEQAHGFDHWRAKQALAADIAVSFGGTELLKGSMLYDHHRGRARIEVDDGTVMVFDGEKAWIAPPAQMRPGPRFHLLTWPYFLAAPFKLRDPGAHLELTGAKDLRGEESETARLTFESGTGDTPEDWYLLYVDPVTHRLQALAYIVTYGTAIEQAEREPHAIVYEGYRDVDGVVLSATWTFHHWSRSEGVQEEPIGAVRLSRLRFREAKDEAFEKPEGAVEDPLATRPGE